MPRVTVRTGLQTNNEILGLGTDILNYCRERQCAVPDMLQIMLARLGRSQNFFPEGKLKITLEFLFSLLPEMHMQSRLQFLQE